MANMAAAGKKKETFAIPSLSSQKKCGLLQISGWEEEERTKGKEIKISHFASPRFAEKKLRQKIKCRANRRKNPTEINREAMQRWGEMHAEYVLFFFSFLFRFSGKAVSRGV